jgi:hypothetical protein
MQPMLDNNDIKNFPLNEVVDFNTHNVTAIQTDSSPIHLIKLQQRFLIASILKERQPHKYIRHLPMMKLAYFYIYLMKPQGSNFKEAENGEVNFTDLLKVEHEEQSLASKASVEFAVDYLGDGRVGRPSLRNLLALETREEAPVDQNFKKLIHRIPVRGSSTHLCRSESQGFGGQAKAASRDLCWRIMSRVSR